MVAPASRTRVMTGASICEMGYGDEDEDEGLVRW